jgi:hypothetical protein
MWEWNKNIGKETYVKRIFILLMLLGGYPIVWLFLNEGSFKTQVDQPPSSPVLPAFSQNVEATSIPEPSEGEQIAAPALTYSCCGYPSSGNPYLCCTECLHKTNNVCDRWGRSDGSNCTWWAWREYKNYTGVSLPVPGYGNAKEWKTLAQPNGSPPRYGSVVVFQPGVPGYPDENGHVAYVDWVDNPTNPTKFKTSNMGCGGDCTIKYYGPYSVQTGINFIYPPNSIDITKPTNPPSINSSHVLNQWSANPIITVNWAGATDPGNPNTGIGGYSWAWTQDANTVPDTQQESDGNTSQTSSPALATGQSWYFHIRARDKNNNWADGATHYGPFWIDANPPSNPNVQETHSIPDATWQNTVYNPAFTWSGASDGNGSGIVSYTYYWGDNLDGIPDTQTTQTSFDPPAPCLVSSTCTRFLRLKTSDAVGRSSEARTLYTFQYDGQAPTGTFQINNGAAVAYQVAVKINVHTTDLGSELYQMRLSNDGQIWQDGWQPYESDFWWNINAYPDVTQTVHLELRDLAGNVTALPPQTIRLDLSGKRPSSANYQIITDVQGRGGDLKTSGVYRLTSTIGQPIAGSGTNGGLYKLESGFQGAWPANPGILPPVEHYHLLSSVIGQGGGVKFSQNYQINTTTGQPAQTGERSSANYRLLSGFWAQVPNGGQAVLSLTPAPEYTPVLRRMATPQTTAPMVTPSVAVSEYYGVSINQGSLFTYDYRVTLYLDAPDAVEMMVSNDGGFGGAYWEAYAQTKTWEIDFYQNYVLPRIVYVRYRDANGKIYGNFTDDIIYDPNLPTGSVTIANVAPATLSRADVTGANRLVTLNLNLQDDLSGVGDVQIVIGDTSETTPWEAYAPVKQVAAQAGDVIRVYYRDIAGNEPLYPFELDVPGMNSIYLPQVIR